MVETIFEFHTKNLITSSFIEFFKVMQEKSVTTIVHTHEYLKKGQSLNLTYLNK